MRRVRRDKTLSLGDGFAQVTDQKKGFLLRPALLVLEDGSVFHGQSIGAAGEAVGEVVFNTGMTGYQEVLTDPSYAGQLVTFTYPELGNTGVNGDDQEADHPHARGVIARQLSPCASNWRCSESLDDWMERHGLVGICGVDTRLMGQHRVQIGIRGQNGDRTAMGDQTVEDRSLDTEINRNHAVGEVRMLFQPLIETDAA